MRSRGSLAELLSQSEKSNEPASRLDDEVRIEGDDDSELNCSGGQTPDDTNADSTKICLQKQQMVGELPVNLMQQTQV